MAPCTHPGTSREVNEARRPHTCSRPCAFEETTKSEKKKHTKKSAPPKTHHEIHSSPATATTSRRFATKHVPRVRPYSSASIDSGFVKIGFLQLSQSVKTTNVTHTLTDTQTDQTNFIKSWKTSAVSTTDWIIKTQPCKLRGTSDTFVRRAYSILRSISFIIWFLWTKPTIWLLIPGTQFHKRKKKIVRACSLFYPYEGYRSVTPLDSARVNRTIFHNHSVHWYYITLIRVGIILITILM